MLFVEGKRGISSHAAPSRRVPEFSNPHLSAPAGLLQATPQQPALHKRTYCASNKVAGFDNSGKELNFLHCQELSKQYLSTGKQTTLQD